MSTASLPGFGTPHFGLTKTLRGKSFDQAVAHVTEELKKVGFGIITTIDMKETLHQKISVDLDRPYVVLGACNPKIAYDAMQHDPAVGLLVPCNFVVAQEPDGSIVVSSVSPLVLFSAVGGENLHEFAQQVQEKMQAMIEAL